MATLSLGDRLPSGQGLSQVPPTQSPYSVGQVWLFEFLFVLIQNT